MFLDTKRVEIDLGNAVLGVLVQGFCSLEMCFGPFGTVLFWPNMAVDLLRADTEASARSSQCKTLTASTESWSN